MLEDKPRNRILLEDGTSLVDIPFLVKKIIRNEEIPETTRTLKTSETENYLLHYGKDFSFDGEEENLIQPNNHVHTEEEFDLLLRFLEESPRFSNGEMEIRRIQKELSFFVKTCNVLFLLEVKSLIDKFKSDGVVWGVGRGSACASFVLYLLEVHDINPMEFDIDFFELSKEQDDDRY